MKSIASSRNRVLFWLLTYGSVLRKLRAIDSVQQVVDGQFLEAVRRAQAAVEVHVGVACGELIDRSGEPTRSLQGVQLVGDWCEILGAACQGAQRGILRAIAAVDQTPQFAQPGALGAVLLAELLLQAAICAELARERVAPLARPIALGFELQSERVEEQIDPEQPQFPAPVEPLIAWRAAQNLERAVAVHSKELLREQDAAVAAVAL